MNIFFIDKDPIIAAQMLCNKHVVKMILESGQMLSGQWKNHPCTKWAWTSSDNYSWLLEHAKELCREYTWRYGRHHKWEERIFGMEIPDLPSGFTTPYLAMPDDCKGSDPVDSYRAYYHKHKKHFAKWTRRETPEWMRDYKKQNVMQNLVS